MSKPIFIIKLPQTISHKDHALIQEDLYVTLGKEYYVLTITNFIGVNVEFECYNTTDLDIKSFDELKEIVSTILNK